MADNNSNSRRIDGIMAVTYDGVTKRLEDAEVSISFEQNPCGQRGKGQVSSILELRGRVVGYSCKGNGAFGGTLRIERVIFNFPATVVFWSDGTKTVVKWEKYRKRGSKPPRGKSWREAGLLNAIAKKMYGTDYIGEVERWATS